MLKFCLNFTLFRAMKLKFNGKNSAKSKRKMKRNALRRAVKIFDFGIPRVGNRVEQICSFDFAFKFA